MRHSLMLAVFCTLICCALICCAQVQAGGRLPDMTGEWVASYKEVCWNDVTDPVVVDWYIDSGEGVPINIVTQDGALLAGYIGDDKLTGVLRSQGKKGDVTVEMQSYGGNNRNFLSGTVSGKGANMTIRGTHRSAEEITEEVEYPSMCSGFFTARRDE